MSVVLCACVCGEKGLLSENPEQIYSGFNSGATVHTFSIPMLCNVSVWLLIRISLYKQRKY